MPHTAAYHWLDDQLQSVEAQLTEWCEINSGSRHVQGLHRMADRLCADWRACGIQLDRKPLLQIHEIDDSGNSQSWTTGDALVCRIRPLRQRRVMLAIHYDTVYGIDSPFQYCDDSRSGRLHGPGVADAKGGLLVMTKAIEAAQRFALAQDIGLNIVLNPDEEIGAPASAALLREHADECDFGLLFEPCLPSGSLVSRRKGSGNFTITVRGRSAHAGREPELGRNAITHLARIVTEVDSLQAGQLTVNVGKILGGDALNRVPDLAIARLNVRAGDPSEVESFESQLHEIAERSSHDGYQCHIDGGFQNPPKLIDSRGQQLQTAVTGAAESLGQTITWLPTGGACDGNKLAAWGLPNVDTMGPLGAGLHSEDEWVNVSSIIDKAKLLLTVLVRYSDEQFQLGM